MKQHSSYLRKIGEVQTHEEATVYVKELDIFLTVKSSRIRQQFYRLESFAMNKDTHTSGSTVKNHISKKKKTVFGYSANTETFVLIVFPGLSMSSSSSLSSSTSMTPSRQEIDHPTSSSSSSTSRKTLKNFSQLTEPVVCRECTLPRDEESSDPKGWIRVNTKIGPVLEVTTSYLQGKHGVEIRIESVNNDNSPSWVRISHGLNKLVTDLIDKKYDDNEQETSTRRKYLR